MKMMDLLMMLPSREEGIMNYLNVWVVEGYVG